jgi:hypothetical protein
MDESAESPLVSRTEKTTRSGETKEDSGDEDEILDWSKLAYVPFMFWLRSAEEMEM